MSVHFQLQYIVNVLLEIFDRINQSCCCPRIPFFHKKNNSYSQVMLSIYNFRSSIQNRYIFPILKQANALQKYYPTLKIH
jgi:hypothetical protein